MAPLPAQRGVNRRFAVTNIQKYPQAKPCKSPYSTPSWRDAPSRKTCLLRFPSNPFKKQLVSFEMDPLGRVILLQISSSFPQNVLSSHALQPLLPTATCICTCTTPGSCIRVAYQCICHSDTIQNVGYEGCPSAGRLILSLLMTTFCVGEFANFQW